jgi:hypothetical protein
MVERVKEAEYELSEGIAKMAAAAFQLEAAFTSDFMQKTQASSQKDSQQELGEPHHSSAAHHSQPAVAKHEKNPTGKHSASDILAAMLGGNSRRLLEAERIKTDVKDKSVIPPISADESDDPEQVVVDEVAKEEQKIEKGFDKDEDNDEIRQLTRGLGETTPEQLLSTFNKAKGDPTVWLDEARQQAKQSLPPKIDLGQRSVVMAQETPESGEASVNAESETSKSAISAKPSESDVDVQRTDVGGSSRPWRSGDIDVKASANAMAYVQPNSLVPKAVEESFAHAQDELTHANIKVLKIKKRLEALALSHQYIKSGNSPRHRTKDDVEKGTLTNKVEWAKTEKDLANWKQRVADLDQKLQDAFFEKEKFSGKQAEQAAREAVILERKAAWETAMKKSEKAKAMSVEAAAQANNAKQIAMEAEAHAEVEETRVQKQKAVAAAAEVDAAGDDNGKVEAEQQEEKKKKKNVEDAATTNTEWHASDAESSSEAASDAEADEASEEAPMQVALGEGMDLVETAEGNSLDDAQTLLLKRKLADAKLQAKTSSEKVRNLESDQKRLVAASYRVRAMEDGERKSEAAKELVTSAERLDNAHENAILYRRNMELKVGTLEHQLGEAPTQQPAAIPDRSVVVEVNGNANEVIQDVVLSVAQDIEEEAEHILASPGTNTEDTEKALMSRAASRITTTIQNKIEEVARIVRTETAAAKDKAQAELAASMQAQQTDHVAQVKSEVEAQARNVAAGAVSDEVDHAEELEGNVKRLVAAVIEKSQLRREEDSEDLLQSGKEWDDLQAKKKVLEDAEGAAASLRWELKTDEKQQAMGERSLGEAADKVKDMRLGSVKDSATAKLVQAAHTLDMSRAQARDNAEVMVKKVAEARAKVNDAERRYQIAIIKKELHAAEERHNAVSGELSTLRNRVKMEVDRSVAQVMDGTALVLSQAESSMRSAAAKSVQKHLAQATATINGEVDSYHSSLQNSLSAVIDRYEKELEEEVDSDVNQAEREGGHTEGRIQTVARDRDEAALGEAQSTVEAAEAMVKGADNDLATAMRKRKEAEAMVDGFGRDTAIKEARTNEMLAHEAKEHAIAERQSANQRLEAAAKRLPGDSTGALNAVKDEASMEKQEDILREKQQRLITEAGQVKEMPMGEAKLTARNEILREAHETDEKIKELDSRISDDKKLFTVTAKSLETENPSTEEITSERKAIIVKQEAVRMKNNGALDALKAAEKALQIANTQKTMPAKVLEADETLELIQEKRTELSNRQRHLVKAAQRVAALPDGRMKEAQIHALTKKASTIDAARRTFKSKSSKIMAQSEQMTSELLKTDPVTAVHTMMQRVRHMRSKMWGSEELGEPLDTLKSANIENVRTEVSKLMNEVRQTIPTLHKAEPATAEAASAWLRETKAAMQEQDAANARQQEMVQSAAKVKMMPRGNNKVEEVSRLGFVAREIDAQRQLAATHASAADKMLGEPMILSKVAAANVQHAQAAVDRAKIAVADANTEEENILREASGLDARMKSLDSVTNKGKVMRGSLESNSKTEVQEALDRITSDQEAAVKASHDLQREAAAHMLEEFQMTLLLAARQAYKGEKTSTEKRLNEEAERVQGRIGQSASSILKEAEDSLLGEAAQDVAASKKKLLVTLRSAVDSHRNNHDSPMTEAGSVEYVAKEVALSAKQAAERAETEAEEEAKKAQEYHTKVEQRTLDEIKELLTRDQAQAVEVAGLDEDTVSLDGVMALVDVGDDAEGGNSEKVKTKEEIKSKQEILKEEVERDAEQVNESLEAEKRLAAEAGVDISGIGLNKKSNSGDKSAFEPLFASSESDSLATPAEDKVLLDVKVKARKADTEQKDLLSDVKAEADHADSAPVKKADKSATVSAPTRAQDHSPKAKEAPTDVPTQVLTTEATEEAKLLENSSMSKSAENRLLGNELSAIKDNPLPTPTSITNAEEEAKTREVRQEQQWASDFNKYKEADIRDKQEEMVIARTAVQKDAGTQDVVQASASTSSENSLLTDHVASETAQEPTTLDNPHALLKDVNEVMTDMQNFANVLQENREQLVHAYRDYRVARAQQRMQRNSNLGESSLDTNGAFQSTKANLMQAASRVMELNLDTVGKGYKLARELLTEGCFEQAMPEYLAGNGVSLGESLGNSGWGIVSGSYKTATNPKTTFAQGLARVVKAVGMAYTAGVMAREETLNEE